MALLAFLLVPIGLAVLTGIAAGVVRRYPVAWSVGLALVALLGAAGALWMSWSGLAAEFTVPWIEPLGIDFALHTDAFRSLFLAIICGTAISIFLFAGIYFRIDRRLPAFLAILLLFSACMIGIVLSDDLLVFFLFWEGTSLLSFLLIGWDHGKEEVRWKASQSFLVTVLGGLVLLAGLVLLKMASGASTLTDALGTDLSAHALAPAIIALIGVGAMTKSAQFPFHFWLPNAMAGPTPVSAFLHSATMVKAGVFLLALAAPALSGHALWTPLFVTAGLLTVGAAVIGAWNQRDLKALLAATTLAALGHLTLLAGIGTPAALQAFVVFLVAHALYKAPLFLAAGVLEKAYGTRDVTALRGAAYGLPVVGLAVVISVASLLGLLPLPGFVGKEYLLKAKWSVSPALAVLTALSFAGVIAVALRGVLPLVSRGDVRIPKSRTPRSLQWVPWISTGAAVVLALGFPWWSRELLAPAAGVLSGVPAEPFKLWPGVGAALFLSLGALALGAVVAWRTSAPRGVGTREGFFDGLYRTLFDALGRGSKQFASALQDRPLQVHVGIVLVITGLFAGFQILRGGLPLPDYSVDSKSLVPTVLAGLMALAAVGAALARTRLELLVFLSLLGLLIALLYSFFSAPDLALTQLLTETVLLLLLVTVLRKLPPRSPEARRAPRFALPIAVLGGAVVTAVVLKAKAIEFAPPISGFFTGNSLSEAYGANVVNVILVDFRALDTLGEITVLGIAAIGAMALIRPRILPLAFDPTRSPLLSTAVRLLVPALSLFAAFLFLRGHNNPGGGFIAALVAATAAGFVHLSGVPSRPSRLEPRLIVSGLALAALSGMMAVAAGRPFLTGLWWHGELPGGAALHLGTPLLFDAGVFLAVLGFALSFLRRLLPTSHSSPSWN